MRSIHETVSDKAKREAKLSEVIGRYEDLLKRKKVLTTLAQSDVSKREQYDNVIHNVTRTMMLIRERFPEYNWSKYDE